MESFMSWVLKTELHYLALLLFAEIHILPPTVPGAIAFGLVLEVEMVLSTQCIMQPKPRKMLIHVAGDQLELHQRRCIIYHLKTIHFRRYWLFCGVRRKSFEDMTMEGRMTVCNLSIEMGARGGMIAPDQTTLII
jgi:3-isopropylmalate/(R)-2-methylmalate dehydratase large subunit